MSALTAHPTLTWLVAVTATALALYTTYNQLSTFKKLTKISPTGTRSVGVEQSTEDAIRLTTLSTLARGVNPELRSAALKILCERALQDSALETIISSLETADIPSNLVALRVIGLLAQNTPVRRLAQSRVYKALVDLLYRSTAALPVHDALYCQREAVSLISRLYPLATAEMQAEMDTGLTDWMRAREAGEQLTEETLVEVIAAVIRPSSVSGGSVGGSAQMGDYMPGTRPFELEHDWMEVDSVEDALRAFVDVATEVPQEIVDEVLGEMMARRATT